MMNLAKQQTQIKTMSSREIAKLTGKEHFHVKRDCEVMFDELGLDPKGYIQNWIHPQNGQNYTEYLLTRELVQTLITGYNIKLRHAVIQRLNELEEQGSLTLPNFTDPAEAAIAWATEYKAKKVAIAQAAHLENQVNQLTPKAKALDVIANSFGQKTITNVAKVLGVQPEKFLRPWMLKHHWIYVGNDGQYHAHAARIKDGHLVEKTRPIPRTSGITELKVTVYVTAHGETLLARRLAGEAA